MTLFVQAYKKKVSGIISLLLIACFTLPANAEEVYYCSTELATGVIKKNGEWTTSGFIPERYTVKFNSDYTQVEGFSPYSPIPLRCHIPFHTERPSLLSCSNFLGIELLLFDKEKLRFTFFSSSVGGYNRNSDNPDTENISAGTCEKF